MQLYQHDVCRMSVYIQSLRDCREFGCSNNIDPVADNMIWCCRLFLAKKVT